MNSKWNTNINIKAETIKLSEENTGANLNDLRFGNTFSDYDTKINREELRRERVKFKSSLILE